MPLILQTRIQFSCSIPQSKISPLKEAQSAIGVLRNALNLTNPVSCSIQQSKISLFKEAQRAIGVLRNALDLVVQFNNLRSPPISEAQSAIGVLRNAFDLTNPLK